jgi:Carboxypeptidase regulatory-like domain
MKLRSICSAGLLLLLVVTGAMAQSASLAGVVTDVSKGVVQNASVTITNSGTGIKRTVSTNSAGLYTAPFLSPGTYEVTVQAQGFQLASRSDVSLATGQSTRLDFELQPMSVQTEVTVEARADLIERAPGVSTLVDHQFVDNMPLNGRTFQSLIALTPGMVQTGASTFSVNGQRDNTNYFTIDGVSANTGISVASSSQFGLGTAGAGQSVNTTASGLTQSLITVDSMQEFRVQTSGYSAEFGRFAGGQIQLTSRSGSNAYHGTAFDYLRNDAFDAMSAYAKWQNATLHQSNIKPPVRQNDFGLTLGGPVRVPRLYNGKNKTFFFVNYEGLRLLSPTSRFWNVPSAANRADNTLVNPVLQPWIQMAALPNAVQNGQPVFAASYSTPSGHNSGSIRVDQTINNKLTIFGRYADTPSYSNGRSTSSPNEWDNTSYDTKALTLGATMVLTNTASNEFRGNWTTNGGSAYSTLDTFGGASLPTPAMLALMFPSAWSASPDNASFSMQINQSATVGPTGAPIASWSEGWQYGTSRNNTQRQINLVDNLSWSHSKHSLRFGVDYRYLFPIAAPSQASTSVNYSGSATGYTGAAYATNPFITGIQSFAQVTTQDRVIVHMKNASLYMQDTWRLTHNLTLDYGLRWEYDPPPVAVGTQSLYAFTPINLTNFSANQLSASGTPLYKTKKDAFAPRVGLSYQLWSKPGLETVIRGGYGLFYDTGQETGLTATGFYPHSRSASFPTTAPWTTAATPALPTINIATPYGNVLSYPDYYTIPHTHQWNVAIQQGLGRQQVLTVSYLGSAGRKLMRQSFFSGTTVGASSVFGAAYVYSPGDTSDYDALQIQFMRRLSRGLQILSNYTFAKALDTNSVEFPAGTSASGGLLNGVVPQGDRGLSSYDVRHKFNLSASYEIPGLPVSWRSIRALTSRWSFDTIYTAQTGVPLTVTFLESFVSAASSGTSTFRPDIVPGVPIWTPNALSFGGLGLNPAAFSTSFVPTGRQQGNEPRGYFRGQDLSQFNATIRREFRFSEKLKLQLRADAFNLLNHTNYGNPSVALGSFLSTNGVPTTFSQTSTFGRVTSLGGTGGLYGTGGPRSMQLALKLMF